MKPSSSNRLLALTLAGFAVLGTASLDAQASKRAAKAPAKEAPLPELSAEQQANGERVLLGAQACEFNQTVTVQPHAEPKGYFDIGYKGKTYVLAPEPTTTGAVRLEDKKSGLIWIQIANKSMLMNAKKGQRVVDECIHPSQKA